MGVANPIRGVLLLRDGGEDDAPKRRMDAMEIALAIVEVALGLPDRALIGEGTGGVPMEGRSRAVDFGSSGVGAGRAKGGVVEKKRLFTGGDCVLVEYGYGINGGGGVRYCVSEVGMGGESALDWLLPPRVRLEGTGDAATST